VRAEERSAKLRAVELTCRTTTFLLASAMLTSVATLVGCAGTARVVARDDEGGLFALEGDSSAARSDAERQMRAHCGAGGYRITADAEYTVATREIQEITQGEAGRRLADDQSLRTSVVAGGMPSSGIQPGGAASARLGESPEIYDPATTGATPRLPTPVREHRLEYECNRRDRSPRR
jgi:hypothetical protein